MMSRLQIGLWSALFMLWLAGCTTGFNIWVGVQPAPPPKATHIPCESPTPTELGSTIPLSATVAITATDTISLGLPITATVTGTPPVSATQPVSATAQPTLTLTGAPPVSETLPVTGTVQPTVTMTARAPLTGTLTPAPTLRPTQTTTATAPSTATATRALTPPQTATPGQPPTATSQATATATRTPLPVATNTPTAAATPSPTSTPSPTVTPRPSPTPTGGTPPATPTPAPAGVVYVRSHRGFMQDGAYIVVGEVVNNFGAPVFRVRVTGTFLNSVGQIVATQEVVAMLAQTEPDQSNPFKIQIANAPDDISRYELAVAWDDVSVVSYYNLSVLSQEVRENNGQEVTGEVRNDFTENLGSVVVVVTLYDDAGEVVDVYQGTPQATQLAPNDTSPYTVRIAPPGPFKSVSVQAQGKRAIFF